MDLNRLSNDTTFITNEDGVPLYSRFRQLIKDTEFFDCLVGYFRTTGFNMLSEVLGNTKRIRILIGMGIDRNTKGALGQNEESSFGTLKRKGSPLGIPVSNTELRRVYSENVKSEFDNSDDTATVESSIKTFIEWVRSGKIELRGYPDHRLHAKLYIMGFKEGDKDNGRVITGSSNFTYSGFSDNLEFNVELKNSSDYYFALEKFNELWGRSVDISQDYVQTARTKTWLNDKISPYELYLKFLYEYLREKINIDKQELLSEKSLPEEFIDLDYQRDAVIDAKYKVEQYGGVFLSDVVGLGKTYMAGLLAKELGGNSIVIASPQLLDFKNPGSWYNVFQGLHLPIIPISRGRLHEALVLGKDSYQNVFIDESHIFRNRFTKTYEQLLRICRGKRVILVSATPFNNAPEDILSQLELFQKGHFSNFPNPRVRDLERYFKGLQKRLNKVNRGENPDEYLAISKENAADVRENLLQYVMVRRTRKNIEKYYGEDLRKKKMAFAEVEDPEAVYYQFSYHVDQVFDNTLRIIARELTFSRYTPLLYLKKGLSSLQRTSQMNLGGFMKVLLLKRLESSFFAFKMTVDRFIHSYEQVIAEFNKGRVYVSKEYANKIFELIDQDNYSEIDRLITEDKAQVYDSSGFDESFINNLRRDLKNLIDIKEMWSKVDSDPKLSTLLDMLKNYEHVSRDKVIIFTESSETGEYLGNAIEENIKQPCVVYSSRSSEDVRNSVTLNFDPRSRQKKDDFRLLVSTDVLSEGVNLHRSNVVINYDIPWNPTRLMQRVGRVNRIGTQHSKIRTYNFLPAGRINENIGLEEAARTKLNSFINMLGNDSKLLFDEEVHNYDIFTTLSRKESLVDENGIDVELDQLSYIRKIRDENPDLFEKIKDIPKKCRTAKTTKTYPNSLVTFFRKGAIKKMYRAESDTVYEIDFPTCVRILKASPHDTKELVPELFFSLLDKNKSEFDRVLDDNLGFEVVGKSNEGSLFKAIKSVRGSKGFTEDDEEFLSTVIDRIKEGELPKNLVKRIKQEIENSKNDNFEWRVLTTLRKEIPSDLIKKFEDNTPQRNLSSKEIVLSEYLKGEN